MRSRAPAAAKPISVSVPAAHVVSCTGKAGRYHGGAFAIPMATPDFNAQLSSHRSYLLRVARLQLRNDELAEDVVQDTLVAALQGADGFTRKSSLRTWLTGILKHKIVDAIRRKQRNLEVGSLAEECQVGEFDALFDDTGHWENPPAAWTNPQDDLERAEFFDVLETCLDMLPPNTARVFMMREVMELETDEICRELSITTNNLWVIMYRARMALRACLEQRWFAAGPGGAS
jgi:RNA polymerase sigma-70 factor, ECF subfamily